MTNSSIAHSAPDQQSSPLDSLQNSLALFLLTLLVLVAGGIFRSAVATRLDSFTIDEPYHIAAGVSYVKQGDFRINPEHPPLVKLWVGAFLAATGFHVDPLRVFHDKPDERGFTAREIFLENNPDSVQRRSRIAMWILNGSLLFALGLALRRAFHAVVALGAILFLTLDPTVAAHLPVVMTDLPVALLATTSVVLLIPGFRYGRWPDLLYGSVALGLALGAKHSAPVFFLYLALVGCVMARILPKAGSVRSRAVRLAKDSGALAGAIVILWGLYFFRYTESGGANEVFNRSVEGKINDISSPAYRIILKTMAAIHILPRAYIWGFADTVHAGLEGRAYSQLAFGRVYYSKAPWYFFLGVMAVKLPIGLTTLAMLGVIFYAGGKIPRDWKLPLGVLLGSLFCFLLVLRSGATYGGVRHALPAISLCAVLAGVASHFAVKSHSWKPKLAVGIAFLLAAVSALPVIRPWEYFNEIVGGPAGGYIYFDDEGTDLGQRSKELASYYHDAIQVSGEIPLIQYQWSREEREARNVEWLGRDLGRDEARMNSRVSRGTVITSGKFLGKRLWWNSDSLRTATPVARFGELLVFQGNFDMSSSLARTLYFAGLRKEYAEKPDLIAAEHLLTESVQADASAFFVHIELANLLLKRGSREDALHEFKEALLRAPDQPTARRPIQQQIERFSLANLEQIPPLRNPQLE